MPDFDGYLRRIRAGLRVNPPRAEEICAELRSHLEADAMQSQQTQLGSEEAANSAVRTLGDPDAIARELTRANYRHRMGGYEMAKRSVIWTVLALLVAWSAAFVHQQNQMDKRGWTSLHYAVLNGRTDEVETLLAKGADANGTPTDGNTPLILAARDGNVEIAGLLLAHGADVNASGYSGRTALHAAASARSAEVTRLLLAHGANVNAWDKYWQTPLLVAATQGSAEVVEVLLAHGARPNLSDRFRWAPLHLAALNDNAKIAAALLEAGAKVNTRTSTRYGGVTPLRLARSPEVVELLRKHGGTL